MARYAKHSKKHACGELGLLKDDKEFIDAINEAFISATGGQMRNLFVRLLNMNTMNQPSEVWNSTWNGTIVYNRRRALNLPCHYLI